MSILDPQLRVIQSQKAKTNIRRLTDSIDFAVEATDSEPLVTVLVEFDCPEDDLVSAGLSLRAVAGDIATGDIALGDLDTLASVDGVGRVEASRPLHDELDLSLNASNVGPVHAGPPGLRGDGVIVGIIDSGIDIAHPNFMNPDGTTRILAIWDQSLGTQAGESTPPSFTYGVEYTAADIDNEVADGMQGNIVRHRDSARARFHGTHVAGIAAGDGSKDGNGQPAFTYIGVAPEADIVLVRNTGGGGRGLGDSANTVDALRYIFDLASRLGKPVVINQSQGDNVGPHDGTSLLERAIDNFLGGPGRAMVKSAGNEGAKRHHASGTVPAGRTETVRFNVPSRRDRTVTIDLWYDHDDRFDVTVNAPGGAGSATATAGSGLVIQNFSGNRLIVDSDLNDPANSDNRIFIQIIPTASDIVAGNWEIELTGTQVRNGRFDAWIQRSSSRRPTFLRPHVSRNRTISIPGTAKEIITAASYVNRGAGAGSISTFSSLGPTRDGRQAPIVAAPGQGVTSAAPVSGDVYSTKDGTSMAAPHVTGAIALMLQQNSNLTQAQIKDCLVSSAVSNGQTGATPNNAWGHGILDVAALIRCRNITLPPTSVPPCRPTLLPLCRPTLVPPCRPTIVPPCLPATVAPPCRRPTTVPPCFPRTFGPPCPPRTLGPPCPPPRTFGPPCPPRTFGPPCPPRTLGPPCPPPRTFGPPCPPRTFGPPCPPRTFGPPCAIGRGFEGEQWSGSDQWTGGQPETAGGWSGYEGDAGYDPADHDPTALYDLSGYDPTAWGTTAWGDDSWSGAEAGYDDAGYSGAAPVDEGTEAETFGSLEPWYGNPGYEPS